MTPGRAGPLVVIGDALLDRDVIGRSHRLCPDAPVPVVDGVKEYARPGGAGLAAVLAARDGRDVVLVTALADDEAGQALRALLEAELVVVVATTWSGSTPQKVRIRAGEHPLVRVDYGDGRGEVGRVTTAMLRAVAAAGAVLVADYGRGVAADASLRAAVADRAGTAPVVWDPHPRGVPPVPGVTVATPNLAEAAYFAGGLVESGPGSRLAVATGPHAEAQHCAALLRAAWCADAVAVTLGSTGALLDAGDGRPALAPAVEASHGDPCGAGDRFSAALAGRLLDGAGLGGAVEDAVAVAAEYVANGGPASLRGPNERRLATAATAGTGVVRPAPRSGKQAQREGDSG